MKKLLTILFVATMALNAQVPQFRFNLTPSRMHVLVNRATDDPIVQVQEKLQIELPTSAYNGIGDPNGLLAFTVGLPPYYPAQLKFTVKGNTLPQLNGGYIGFGKTEEVGIGVDWSSLKVGSYNIPIEVRDYYLNTVRSVVLVVDVIDSKEYKVLSGSSRVVPHIATGFGWQTSLLFFNPGSDNAVVTLETKSPDGKPASLTDSNASLYSVAIPPHGVSEFTFSKSDPYTITGSAVITPVTGSAPITVNAVYRSTTGTTQEGSVKMTSPVSRLTLPFDNRNGLRSGVALSNTLNYGQDITVKAYGDNGVQLIDTTLNLSSFGQIAVLIDSYFPALSGKMGTIVFESPFNSLNGFVLRFSSDTQFIPIGSVD